MTILRPLALLALLALPLVACSDGDDSASEESPDRPAAEQDTPEGAHPGDSHDERGAEGEGEGEDAPSEGAGGPMCDAAQRVRALDTQANSLMEDATSSALSNPDQSDQELLDAVEELQGLVPELTAAYDDLEQAVPEANAGDVDVVRSFTLSLMEQLSEVTSADDLQQLTGSIDAGAAAAAGAATFELDAVLTQECGSGLAG